MSMTITDFLKFVDAIKNLEQYEQQVKDLRDENERLEKNIKATAEVSELLSLREAAEKALEEATQTLKQAKAEAAATKEAAKTAYEKKEASLISRETEVVKQVAAANAVLASAQKLQADTENRLAKELKDVLARKEQLIVAEQEVAERLAKLKAVMG